MSGAECSPAPCPVPLPLRWVKMESTHEEAESLGGAHMLAAVTSTYA